MRQAFGYIAPALLALSLVASAGCKRSVCGFENGGLDPQVSARWSELRALIPPTATVCGHYTGSGQRDEAVLVVDFAADDNPWVTIVEHMERQGLQRTSQDISSPDTQSAVLTRANPPFTVTVTTRREKGLVSAELALEY